MTEIERKALALLRECAEVPAYVNLKAIPGFVRAALFRAIEQHEAFRQEVSDAVELANMRVKELKRNTSYIVNHMQQYIIPKPVDPLVEAMQEWWDADGYADIETFRAAIEKRGGKIVWGEGE